MSAITRWFNRLSFIVAFAHGSTHAIHTLKLSHSKIPPRRYPIAQLLRKTVYLRHDIKTIPHKIDILQKQFSILGIHIDHTNYYTHPDLNDEHNKLKYLHNQLNEYRETYLKTVRKVDPLIVEYFFEPLAIKKV